MKIIVKKHIGPSDLSQIIVDAIKTGLEGKYPDLQVERGSIYFYIPENGGLERPVVTVEPGQDPVEHSPGAVNFKHNDKQWRIRATIDASQSDNADDTLEALRSALRKALFRSQSHDFSQLSFAEFEPSDTTLPRPGLPLCSVVIGLSATFYEPLS